MFRAKCTGKHNHREQDRQAAQWVLFRCLDADGRQLPQSSRQQGCRGWLTLWGVKSWSEYRTGMIRDGGQSQGFDTKIITNVKLFSLAEELLAVNKCRRRESHLLLWRWLLMGCIYSSK